jgi:hypothetical protein
MKIIKNPTFLEKIIKIHLLGLTNDFYNGKFQVYYFINDLIFIYTECESLEKKCLEIN